MIKNRKSLRRIQKWGVDQIYDNEITILAWDMGAGKGVTVLTALLDLLDDRKIKRALVIAPLLVATTTWPDEIEEWDHTRDLEWTLIRAEDGDPEIEAFRKSTREFLRKSVGLDAKRAALVANRHTTKAKLWRRKRLAREKTEIHIINREGLAWLWEQFGNGKHWPYDAIIVDEASMFKNGRKRTKGKQLSLFGAAAKARKFAKRVVLMTGTPAPKGLRNLWGLAYIADQGQRLGTSRTKFEERWFNKGYDGWSLEPRPNAEEEITDRLKDIMFTLAPEDYNQLPPFVPNEVRIDLPRRVMEEYRRFERTLVSEEYDVEAVNAGVLSSKLLQFANGSMYQEDKNDVWIHDEKLFALEDIVDEANGEPILVAYSYKFDLARIKKRFKKAVVFDKYDSREIKRRWNNGEIEMLLAHPASVGHGQNIQFGGHIGVWYGLTNDLELYLQFNKRLHRSGQTKAVFMHHIVAKNTEDERLLPLLRDKNATQDSIMAHFRKSLKQRQLT